MHRVFAAAIFLGTTALVFLSLMALKQVMG
jgi:hypothetical protein